MNENKKIILKDLINKFLNINIFKHTIISYFFDNFVKPYNICKDYKPISISKITIPPKLNNESFDFNIKELMEIKYKDALLKFNEVMTTNFKDKDLYNYYNNIRSLNIKEKKFTIENFIFRSIISGSYNSRKNEICIISEGKELTLYHELFHMASSRYKNRVKYSGFHQSSIKMGIFSFGEGINEGYTELLSKRYFKNDILVSDSYEYLTFVAEKLEEIIGKDKMQSLYLNSNLKGLINELEKYIKEDEIMIFISDTDFLVNHLDDIKVKTNEKDRINKCLKNVNRFLIICYSKKLQRIKKIFGLSYSKFIENISIFISELTSGIKIGGIEYEVMSKYDFIESIRESFEKPDINFKNTSK